MSFSLGVWKRRLRGGLMVSYSSLVSGGAGTDLCSLEVGPEGMAWSCIREGSGSGAGSPKKY